MTSRDSAASFASSAALAADLPARLDRRQQLLLGVVAMIAISSPQYVWTLFVKPMQGATGASLTAVQVTFSILIVLQTWLGPLQGWLVERFGARPLLTAGAALTGASWVLSAHASSLAVLYLTYGLLGGIGTGIVYVGVVGLMARWFPDRRGFAIGMVAAGYGFGAVLFTFPVAESIAVYGHSLTLQWFGLILGVVGIAAAQAMRMPPPGWVPPAMERAGVGQRRSTDDGVGPLTMLRTPLFWLLFAMMAMMATGGLMVVSQMSAFAREFGVAGAQVLGMAALPLAMTVDRVTNGLTRPFFGWVSDNIGRENTMALAFFLEALAVLALLAFRDNPTAFVLLSGLVFFGWGEIFSLFPATLADTFGTTHAVQNYGCLYMAAGIGSILGGPLASLLHEHYGSWLPVFHIVIALDAATAALALLALAPMRSAWMASRRAAAPHVDVR